MMARPAWPLRISTCVYGLLLRAYPAKFRRKFGREMLRVFGEMAEDAWRQRGTWGLVQLWSGVLCDVGASATVQHAGEFQRRRRMGRLLFETRWLLPVLAGTLLFAALVTPADPFSMLLVGLPLYGVYLFAFLVVRLRKRTEECEHGANVAEAD